MLSTLSLLRLARDPRLINFDNATKLRFRRDQRSADFVAHGMRRLVGAEAYDALNLKRAHSLLAGKQEVDDAACSCSRRSSRQ